MFLIKIIIFCTALFFSALTKLKHERTIIAFLLFASFFLSNFFDNLIILRILNVSEVIALGFFFGINYKENLRMDLRKYLFLLLIFIIFFHNIYDILFYQLTFQEENSLKIVNPWGLATILSLIFLQKGFRNLSLNEENVFKRYLIIFSWIIGVALILTANGYLFGNTLKMINGTGGVGLGRLSTNDTALFFVIIIIIILSSFFKYKKITKIEIATVIISLFCVYLTSSRLAVLIIFLFFTYALFLNINFKKLVIYSPVLLGISFLGFSIFLNRSGSDLDRRLPNSLEWAYLGSGRLIIWAEYYLAFVTKFGKSLFNYLFGVGYINVLKIYENSNLFQNGWFLDNYDFYPIHSDIFLLFYVSGIVGVFIFLIIFINDFEVKDLSKLGLLTCLILYFIFDMVNYSIFSAFLLGIGLYGFKNKMDEHFK